jgi:hypothetical protein
MVGCCMVRSRMVHCQCVCSHGGVASLHVCEEMDAAGVAFVAELAAVRVHAKVLVAVAHKVFLGQVCGRTQGASKAPARQPPLQTDSTHVTTQGSK